LKREGHSIRLIGEKRRRPKGRGKRKWGNVAKKNREGGRREFKGGKRNIGPRRRGEGSLHCIALERRGDLMHRRGRKRGVLPIFKRKRRLRL